MDDAIKELQDLFKSFKYLHQIVVTGDCFELTYIDSFEVTKAEFTDTVKALEWLEEKHGIKSN